MARNQALKVEWTGNAEGQINISLSGGLTNNTYTALATCRFEASSKSATLPTEVLNAMPKGQGSVGISQVSETTVAAGSHDVVNRFITYPKTSSSQFPALTVTFEN